MVTSPSSIYANPIKALVDGGRALREARPKDFPRQWLLWALQAEIHRYSMEDDYVDSSAGVCEGAEAAFETLERSTDWVHPKLQAALEACRALGTAAELPHAQEERLLEDGAERFPITMSRADGQVGISVSSMRARYVPIFEANLGDPHYCSGLISAFRRRLTDMQRTLGVNHLLFIEKEVGPVGAISMMSSLVEATGLPASIYRETHWAKRAAIAGREPAKGDRVAILYDLIVTGAGICNAADAVMSLRGAITVGSIVLCGYGGRRTSLTTDSGQNFPIEALTWIDDATAVDDLGSGDPDEVRSESVPHHGTREEEQMAEDRPGGDVFPPGSYTRESLPPLSEGALRLLEEIKAGARTRAQEASPSGFEKRTQKIGARISRPDGARVTTIRRRRS